ncbi:MAG: aminotransferase class V-fold PLP-dependent enzyme, partial [Acidimicrobiia bacterium]|nr:aminotransferase class V-fold PLP-dependent enzyme [Acidimicrobiia bacterium]
MFDRLHDLELVARLLHPPARERRELLASAEHYAEGYLERLAELPGYVPDDELARRALDSAPISDDPTPVADALATLWDGVDRVGVNESVGHFFGFIPGPALYASAVGDYLSAVTNRYAGITYGAPGAVRVQQSLIRWMGRLVGYPDTAGGDLTSGGSIANLSAIVSARESADLRSRDVEHSCVYLTRHTHHSVRKALKVAGMGDVAVRLLPIDASYRMRPDALEDAVRADLDAGFRPWLVVASAGSTDAGAVDPLPDIAAIAERHQILLHVDAAYGGAFLLCEPGQRALQGIDRSDSVIIDPHKGLFIPFGLGLVLVKHRDAMVRAFSYEADYLQDTASGDGLVPPAALSPEFTRPNRAIRLWLPLTLYG